jgi:hypothetical protein
MKRAPIEYLRRHSLALLALFIALGGTTYAATGFPANVIGTKQLKKNAVTNPKLKNGAVTGAKVANNSLTGADLLESSLAQVPSAAHAESATSATKATSATNATSATSATNATNATNAINATNADQLGGSPTSAFQSRVTGTCASAKAMSIVGSNGAASCYSAVVPIAADLSVGEDDSDLIAFDAPFGFDISLGTWCNLAAPPATMFYFYSRDPATISWFYSTGTTLYAGGDVVPGGNVLKEFGFDDKRLEGQFIFAQGNHVVTFKLHGYDGGTFCEIRGTATYASS